MATKKTKAKKPAEAKTPKAEARKTPKGSFDRIAFAKDILAKREKDGLSFRMIQAETGIAKTTLQAIEAGQKDLSAASVAQICSWMKANPAKYFKL